MRSVYNFKTILGGKKGVLLGAIGGGFGLFMAWLISYAIESAGGIRMPPTPGSSQGYILNFLLDAKGGLIILILTLISTSLAAFFPSRRASKLNIASSLAPLFLIL